jgi:hypothetical protein
VLQCLLLTQSGHWIESPKKSATWAMKSFRINGVDGRAMIGLGEKDDVTGTFLRI